MGNNPYYRDRPGKHTHDEFEITLSPLGIDGAETPQYSPDECVEEDLAGRGNNQGSRRGPHGSEYTRNERRGG